MLFYILLTLATLGIADTIYLLYKNRPSKTLTCPINGDCHAVLDSKWNKFLGIKNEIWGLLYFIFILVLLLMEWFSFTFFNINLYYVMLAAISFGVLYSAYLTYIQFAKIKTYCFYCLISVGINLLLFITVLFLR